MLELLKGKELWRFTAGSGFAASPAVAEGKLVISTEDGQVFCFQLAP
jgi:outer membrane protein assembly factor BamB